MLTVFQLTYALSNNTKPCSNSVSSITQNLQKKLPIFKDPFEKDEFDFPASLLNYHIFSLCLYLKGLCLVQNCRKLTFRTLEIIRLISLLAANIISFVWNSKHIHEIMPFEYLITIIVLWSISNAITVLYPIVAMLGVGVYNTKLKKKDIFLITCVSILSIVINVFIAIAYYVFTEKVYKIIIFVLLPSNILIEIIPAYLKPKDFSTMHNKVIEKDDPENQGNTNLISRNVREIRIVSISNILHGALNPILRYLIHFSKVGNIVLILFFLYSLISQIVFNAILKIDNTIFWGSEKFVYSFMEEPKYII